MQLVRKWPSLASSPVSFPAKYPGKQPRGGVTIIINIINTIKFYIGGPAYPAAKPITQPANTQRGHAGEPPSSSLQGGP